MSELPDKRSPAYSGVFCDTLEATATTADNAHREIVRGIVAVGAFVVLAKLAAAVKEMVVAWRYGVSGDVDAYLFLFNLVNWPISLWLGLLTSFLVPVLSKRSYESREELRQFRAELTGRTLIAGVVVASGVAVTIIALLKSSLTGLPVNSLNAAFRILLPMVLLVPFGWVISLFSVVMLAAGRHANTLLEGVPAVVMAALVAMVANPSIKVLAWATLTGFIFHAVSLAIPLRRDLPMPRYTGQAPQWSEFWAGFSIMLAGQFLTSLTTLVDQFFAARLFAGALASLSYAQRILALILGLGATAVGRASIPVLARAIDSGRADFRGITMHWVRIVFAGGVAVVAAGWWLGPWVVRLLFQRGAFMARDTQAVVSVFRTGLLQIPFNFSAVLLFYALAGQRQYVAITGIAAVVLVTKLLMNGLLVPIWGTQGVMLSTAIMYATMMLLYLYLLRKTER